MLKRFLPFVAVVAALAVLAGCGSVNTSSKSKTEAPEKEITAQEIIVGSWEGVLDVSYLEEKIFENEKELTGYFTPGSFELPVVFEFSADGGYAVSVKTEETDARIAELSEKLKVALKLYFTDAFSLENSGEALDKFLKEQRISIDEAAQDIITKNALKGTLYAVQYAGRYLPEGDKCFFGEDDAQVAARERYTAFEIKSETEMSIVEIAVPDDKEMQLLKKALPITIKKR